ncbi:uncharacterized protein LOC100836651 [Brachypodium distachyon]|uniref:uncharacterized protein LOC100836651 n=1 Tax=Brachypodium distachyon TaxID=15368 RepID=UPI00071C8AC9|nr:uncharacterized protein LOC100836651 [Brachypodium distachyon]|eukprot:XP_014755931.1 uncharacterized protein LOC100836651 [Brachypodium distachyon]
MAAARVLSVAAVLPIGGGGPPEAFRRRIATTRHGPRERRPATTPPWHCRNKDEKDFVGNERLFCDFCLEEDEKNPLKWVKKLASSDFRELCEAYYFCAASTEGFCERCCPVSTCHGHNDHDNIFQVMHPGELLLVRLGDVNKFYDCTDIQPDIPGSVLIHPRPEPLLGGDKSCGYRDCHHEVAEPYTFCSICCKHKENPYSNWMWRVQGLLKRPFIPRHRWNRFCLECHAPFGYQVCEHHGNHFTVAVIESEGGLVVRFPAGIGSEWSNTRWLDCLGAVQSTRKDMDGGVLVLVDFIVDVPLTRPKQLNSERWPKSCSECDNGINEDKEYCSIQCMASKLPGD